MNKQKQMKQRGLDDTLPLLATDRCITTISVSDKRTEWRTDRQTDEGRSKSFAIQYDM